jgi:hypothetical protein
VTDASALVQITKKTSGNGQAQCTKACPTILERLPHKIIVEKTTWRAVIAQKIVKGDGLGPL